MVGVLRCHDAPWATTAAVEVETCVWSDDRGAYEVTIRDEASLLYPEGGGQPSDAGWIGDARVVGLEKKERCLHYVNKPLKVGTVYDLKVDWERRFDHMQHHSGQHLFSAVAMRLLRADTGSWRLAPYPQPCTLDLLNPDVTLEQARGVEAEVNQAIQNGVEVKSTVFESLEEARIAADGIPSRSLPQEHDFQREKLRIVQIDGLDFNACGGTHVSNTTQLQMLKVVKVQRVKSYTRVSFLVGNRVSTFMTTLLDTASAMGESLSTGVAGLCDKLQLLKDDARTALKINKMLLRQLADTVSKQLASSSPQSNHITYWNEYADASFCRSVASTVAAAHPQHVVVVCGNKVVVSMAPANELEAVAAQICAVLGAKGGCSRGKFQGKFESMEKMEKKIKCIQGQN